MFIKSTIRDVRAHAHEGLLYQTTVYKIRSYHVFRYHESYNHGFSGWVNVSALSTDGSRIVIGNWSHSLTFGVKEGQARVYEKDNTILLMDGSNSARILADLRYPRATVNQNLEGLSQ